MFKNKLKLEKNKKSKIALCLSGGGTRGFVHLGVIKALQEYGLNFDYIVGTSAGSLVGAFLAAGMTYEQILFHLSLLKPTVCKKYLLIILEI